MKHLLAILVVVTVSFLAAGGNLSCSSKKEDKTLPSTVTLDLGRNVTMKLALIPAGKFLMGSPTSEPYRDVDEVQHEVTISKPFYMGVYEVTQDQYEAVTGRNPSAFKGPSNPVDGVSWGDAVEFCKNLSAKTGKTIQLPTEAQWEYACRAGTTTAFNTGPYIEPNQANYDATTYNGSIVSPRKTLPVGGFKPNDFGLYDMHGNVMEWCGDWYGPYLETNQTDPRGPASASEHVLRGGSWAGRGLYCRSAFRVRGTPDARPEVMGFRVVLLTE